jgi:hypothetical protein
VTLRDQACQPQLFAPATHIREHAFSFHALTTYRPNNSHRSIFTRIRKGDVTLPVLSSLPNDSLPPTHSLTPLESALTENASVTPLESALPKWIDLKSFRIRTYEKRWGEGGKLLTRPATTTLLNSSRQPRSMPAGPLQYWTHGATIGPRAETVPPLPVSKPLERTSGVETFGYAQSVLRSFAAPSTVDTVGLDGSGRSGCSCRTGKAGIV